MKILCGRTKYHPFDRHKKATQNRISTETRSGLLYLVRKDDTFGFNLKHGESSGFEELD